MSFWQIELGLRWTPQCFKEFWFYLALLAAPVSLWVGYTLYPDWFSAIDVGWKVVVLMVVWQPLIEELFFRGMLQGKLFQQAWFSVSRLGISRANWLVSLLFMLTHLLYHPPVWALAVIFPSLVFGWFRDRYQSTVPSILLHAFYNVMLLLFSAFFLRA
ncbi:JDVT-CTERM system glutamic-type intramembrane protease [Thiomicrorhabdus sp. zzn3]|uniref:JDVT-CTERM system glutamic-type intramembrane protease MrtJ n=1 Tax=Thiomicrorhabdus sp. zzn3 TaxID=3039775 RepID=UPI00243696EB|nr:JDVT-CTERM system glutamic-type intramembrane protease [Thiomicrorhabdus sp. zzn3]MDG6777161.1 JDVT-CTERM system glutamic-type intramembrane protease [Thiomicrorhabdus sp. zzn3]